MHKDYRSKPIQSIDHPTNTSLHSKPVKRNPHETVRRQIQTNQPLQSLYHETYKIVVPAAS